jgi:hypothetical protein
MTESELEAKRGFCAVCDEQFEIRVGEVRDEEHPFRAFAPVELAPVSPPPPRGLTESREGGMSRLRIRVSVTPALWVPFGVALMLTVMASSSWNRPLLWVPLLACLAMAARSVARVWRSEELEARAGHLWHRRAGRSRWTRIPLDEVRRVSLEAPAHEAPRYIRVVWDGGQALIGRGMGHDELAMLWVAQWIEHEVARARALNPPSPTD